MQSLKKVPKTYCNVATALTACGIETILEYTFGGKTRQLQQRLPLAVLKRENTLLMKKTKFVATALTACGIETGK